jgi:serine/threonine-protein kinase HipA
MNPTPDSNGLSPNISETDNATSFDLALEVAPYFRLKAPTAEAILHQVKAAVGNWKELANALGIASTEQEIMEPAFEG